MDQATPIASQVSNNPYAATATDLSVAFAPEDHELAGRGTRLAAVVLDSVPPLLIALVAAILIVILGEEKSYTMIVAGVVGGIGMLAFVFYQLVLMARYGQTFGKRRRRIRVVRTNTGEKCGLGRYFWLRGALPVVIGIVPLVGSIFGLIDTLMIFSGNRRCIHDLMADTKVVKV